MRKDVGTSLTFERLLAAIDATNAVLVEVPFNKQIAQSLSTVNRAQVPDLPDRIIAATALHLEIPVISRDSKIRLSSVSTIW